MTAEIINLDFRWRAQCLRYLSLIENNKTVVRKQYVAAGLLRKALQVDPRRNTFKDIVKELEENNEIDSLNEIRELADVLEDLANTNFKLTYPPPTAN